MVGSTGGDFESAGAVAGVAVRQRTSGTADTHADTSKRPIGSSGMPVDGACGAAVACLPGWGTAGRFRMPLGCPTKQERGHALFCVGRRAMAASAAAAIFRLGDLVACASMPRPARWRAGKTVTQTVTTASLRGIRRYPP